MQVSYNISLDVSHFYFRCGPLEMSHLILFKEVFITSTRAHIARKLVKYHQATLLFPLSPFLWLHLWQLFNFIGIPECMEHLVVGMKACGDIEKSYCNNQLESEFFLCTLLSQPSLSVGWLLLILFLCHSALFILVSSTLYMGIRTWNKR